MVETLLDELILSERKKMVDLAKEILEIPLTEDDLLQPNDFPELESNPHFRFQEGIVIGLLTFQSAYKAAKRLECSTPV